MPFTRPPSTVDGTPGIGIGNVEFPSVSRATVIGITFAIVGNVLISFALNLQKLAHAQLEAARALRLYGPEAVESESDVSDDGASAGGTAVEGGVPHDVNLPPEVEREARVWHGNWSEASLPLGPRLETDPLMSLPTTASMEVPPLTPTYGVLFPSTYEGHVRGVTPPRRYPKVAKQPGTGVGGKITNRPIRHGPNYESEYLKSKLWYVS
jgi:magnesium transporter